MENTGVYDPYSYNPMLRAFYVTSNFTNRDIQPPAVVQAAAADNPQAAQHIYAVWAFLDWMQASNPALYRSIANQAPALVNAPAAVLGGKVSPKADAAPTYRGTSYAQINGLSGLGDMSVDDYGNAILTGPSATTAPAIPDTITAWGSQMFDLAGKYLQYDQQRQILKLNITRAEKGLPPIDSSALAPTVNIGASPGVTQLGYLAVGGLVLAGVVAAFSKAKKK